MLDDTTRYSELWYSIWDWNLCLDDGRYNRPVERLSIFLFQFCCCLWFVFLVSVTRFHLYAFVRFIHHERTSRARCCPITLFTLFKNKNHNCKIFSSWLFCKYFSFECNEERATIVHTYIYFFFALVCWCVFISMRHCCCWFLFSSRSFVALVCVCVFVCFQVRNGPQCHFNLHRILWKIRRRRRCFLSAHRHRSILRKSHMYTSVVYPLTFGAANRLDTLLLQCIQFTGSFNCCTDDDGGARASLHSGLYKLWNMTRHCLCVSQIIPKRRKKTEWNEIKLKYPYWMRLNTQRTEGLFRLSSHRMVRQHASRRVGCVVCMFVSDAMRRLYRTIEHNVSSWKTQQRYI